MTAGTQHIDVGAYALGLLEEPDRRAFEAHLSGCLPCHEELGVLRSVAATLDGIAPIEDPVRTFPAEPDPSKVSDLLQRRARRERSRRISRTMLSAAAGVVLLAGAFGTGLTLSSSDDGQQQPPAKADGGVAALLQNGHRVSANDPGTGVNGTVAMEPKMWGTNIGFELSKVRGPLECELVAIDKRGRAHTVMGWSVPRKGYGQPDSPAPLTAQGGTALKPSEIARFEVRTIGTQRTLLTIPT
ncbi:anti-sigma factor family protein [Spirillospora sp. NPDC048911]|uniref:anti-sigma factor n=1 Tax=Spirillospora sp. NPDC048911 TaxID=3364527 RepID=UPI0037235FFE